MLNGCRPQNSRFDVGCMNVFQLEHSWALRSGQLSLLEGSPGEKQPRQAEQWRNADPRNANQHGQNYHKAPLPLGQLTPAA
jgi:hypothetical protein